MALLDRLLRRDTASADLRPLWHRVVEVAREHGGREVLRLPLQWPPRSAAKSEAAGTTEVGLVRLTSKP